MELEEHACLVATLRKASQICRSYTQNVRDAWKERAKLLNAVPVSGLLPSCPEMFLAFKGGVDGAVVTSLFHDWNCLCNFIRKSIQVKDGTETYNFEEKVRAYSHEDFKAMLSTNGLRLIDCFGSYDLQAFDPKNSSRLILVFKADA